jgi:hypothetical protein
MLDCRPSPCGASGLSSVQLAAQRDPLQFFNCCCGYPLQGRLIDTAALPLCIYPFLTACLPPPYLVHDHVGTKPRRTRHAWRPVEPDTSEVRLSKLALQGVAAYSFAPIFTPGSCFETPAGPEIDCSFWDGSPFTLRICPGNGGRMPSHTCQ